MAFCTKCGSSLAEGTQFCPQCGTPVDKLPANDNNSQIQQQYDYDQQNNYQNQYSYDQQNNYQNQYNYGQQNTNQNNIYAQQRTDINTNGLMVWSIINLFFCWPLSIYSLVVLNNVHKAQTQTEAENNYKKAKTICTITTIIGIVVIFIALASDY